MRKIRKNKTLVMALAIVLAVITAISAVTFAWWAAADTVRNHLETANISDSSVKIWEEFSPPPNWVPGTNVNKKVGVSNIGDGFVLTRVSFEEILKQLEVDGSGFLVANSDTAKWTIADTTKVPALYENERLTWKNTLPYNDPPAMTPGAAGSYWTEIDATRVAALNAGTDSLFTLSGGPLVIPAGAKVFYHYEVSFNPLGGLSRSYEFIIYADITVNTYDAMGVVNGTKPAMQKVTATCVVEIAKTTTGKDILVLDQFNFVSYNKTAAKQNDWTKLFGAKTVTTAAATNKKPSTVAPITVGAPTNIAIGGVALPPGVSVIPVIAPINFNATPLAGADNCIILYFDANNVVFSGAPVNGRWWYNQADGFFYFIGALGSGQTTPLLLQGIGLKTEAGDAYKEMNYDLYVQMQAIQNTFAAVTSATGWGIPAGALQNALKSFCDQ